MRFTVNPADDLPIYRQIMRQVIEAIAAARLTPGERMLSHRELSERLAIAPLTVKKAYDELESLGYIESHRGRGTFVAATPPKLARAAQAEQVADAARVLLARAYLAGLEFPDVVDALRAADRDLASGAPLRHTNKAHG